MRESVVHSTENNNLYLYDAQHMFSLLIHPELGRAHEKSENLNPYYLKKYEYQKRHGFWGNAEPPDFETNLDESSINSSIIQTKKLVFEVTDHCNLNCPYCSVGELYEFSKRERNHMNSHYAINLLKYIVGLKLKNNKGKLMICFFGGEPLVNSRFIKRIVKAANDLNANKELELRFFMTTNATLIHKHIVFLVENKFGLLISLDGDEKGQSYRTFAKNNQNSFRRVIANIDMIQRDYPDYFTDNVYFNAVLHSRNSIKNIYEFIYNRYHKIPTISELNTGNINRNKQDIFDRMFQDKWESEEEYQKSPNFLPETRGELTVYKETSLFMSRYSINFYISNPLYLLYDRIKLCPTGTCMPFEKKIFLNTHHNLFPCEKINHKYSMGKVNENIIIDIPKIAREYNCFYNHFKKVCLNCYASPRSCRACMFTIGNLDKLDSEDLICNEFQDQEAFKLKLKRIFSFLENKPKWGSISTDIEMLPDSIFMDK